MGVVKRTLRLGPGLAERSPLPPWGGSGEADLWGLGEKYSVDAAGS